jgi:hypothetical protein
MGETLRTITRAFVRMGSRALHDIRCSRRAQL